MILILGQAQSGAQDLIRNLRQLSRDAGRLYLDPAASSFGAAMNTGWFHRAPDRQRMGFDISIGLAFAGGLYFGAPRSFNSQGTFSFNALQAGLLVDSALSALQGNPRIAALTPDQRQSLRDTLVSRVAGPDLRVDLLGPTAIGSGDSLFATFRGLDVAVTLPEDGGPAFDTTLSLAGRTVSVPLAAALEDLPFTPVAAPSLTLGTLFGTQAVLRWLPKIELSDRVGELGLWGAGIQHNLAYWAGPSSPVDLTLDLHWQRLEVGDVLVSNAFAAGAVASRQFGTRRLGWMPFAGAAWESSEVEADYDLVLEAPGGNVTRPIRFTIDGRNETRFTMGLALQFFHINVAGEYNLGEYDTFGATVSVVL